MFKKLRKSFRETKKHLERQRAIDRRDVKRQRSQLTDFTRVRRTFEVAGMFAYPAEVAAAQLAVGARVRLIREPRNAYDPNAVAIIGPAGRLRWGYMPATLATQYAPVMDRGVKFNAVITRLYGDGGEIDDAEITVFPPKLT
ncbi:HIRAN domain-containing protein [Brevibacterium otitidis]|uniref:HIRAN domain-containing protein n=1 Tax=Brevibacterium otitidis TaxID=53364 RepID=A0ABV5X4F1_9MICO|nr:hypothetical protein GCM10023233_23040 [Brevibacterium otitidis]